METKQKKWLLVSLIMFVVPEILFSFVLSMILLFFNINFNYLIGRLVGEQFFIDNQLFIFIAGIIELLGIIGLLVWNIKFNRNRFKLIFSILIFIFLIIILLTLYAGLIMQHGIGF